MKEDKVWTVPNIITCVRVALSFVWLALAMQISILDIIDSAVFNPYALLVALFFVALSLSDALDGFIARKYQKISTVGIYLDPISDKILVLAGLLFLTSIQYVSVFIILIIFCREFLVDALRIMAATKNIVVSASALGKIKTATTLTAICFYLCAIAGPGIFLGSTCYLLGALSLTIAIIFTIASAIDYCIKITREIRHAA